MMTGCCSLRVEHITVDNEENTLTMDFLGKDSMRHFQTYELAAQYGEIGLKVLKNFETFCKKKKPEDEVFDRLAVGDLNDHLKSLMPGLSAKVFRTYNASSTLQLKLPHVLEHHTSDQEKVLSYNAANREVAILCNHQRTVSKAAENSLEKLNQYVLLLEEQKVALHSMRKRRKKGKDVKLKGEPGKTTEEKRKVAHLFMRQPTVDQVEKRIVAWEKRIATQKLNLKNKDDNKTVALGTSKINYMDPRISVAWAKRNECPIEKIFASALRDKFPWAMSVDDTWKF